MKGYLYHLGLLVLSLVLLVTASGLRPTGQFDPNDPQLSSFLVIPPSTEVMDRVASIFEVTHRHGDGFEVIVPAHRVNELYALVPDARLLEEDILEEIRNVPPTWMAGYHDFASVEQHLRDVVTQYPDLAKLEVYGRSKEGRPLFALKLSDNVHLDEAEPDVMLTAATHGDELISVEVVLGILDHLVANHRTDRRVAAIVENREIWILPVVNPDGYVRRQRYSNGVDPNREYPYPSKPNRTPNECIAAVMKFFHDKNIRGSLDFHASGSLFMYPWAYTTQGVPSNDEQAFSALTRYMAQANGYRPGQISKILYAAPGSSADYYYWKNRSLAVAVEIGHSKVPNPSQIPAQVKANLESTLRFLETVRR